MKDITTMPVTTLPAQAPVVETTVETERKQRLHEHNQRVYTWGEAFDPKYRGVTKILGWAVDIDTREASISVATIRRRHRQRLRRTISRATVFRHLADLQSAGIVQIEAQYWDNGSQRGSLYRVNFGLVIRHGQAVQHEFGTPIFTETPPSHSCVETGVETPITKGESNSDGLRAGGAPPAEDEYEIASQWAGCEFEEGMKFTGASGKNYQLEWDDDSDQWVLVDYENENEIPVIEDDLRAGLTDGTLILTGDSEPVPEENNAEVIPENLVPSSPRRETDPDPVVPDAPAEPQLHPGLIFHSWDRHSGSLVLACEIDGNWLVYDNGTGKELGMRTPDELLTDPYYPGGFYQEDADVEAIMASLRERKYSEIVWLPMGRSASTSTNADVLTGLPNTYAGTTCEDIRRILNTISKPGKLRGEEGNTYVINLTQWRQYPAVQLTDAEQTAFGILLAELTTRVPCPHCPENLRDPHKRPCEEHRCRAIKNNNQRCRMAVAEGHVLFCQYHGCRYELAPGVFCDTPLAGLVQGWYCTEHAHADYTDPHPVAMDTWRQRAEQDVVQAAAAPRQGAGVEHGWPASTS